VKVRQPTPYILARPMILPSLNTGPSSKSWGLQRKVNSIARKTFQQWLWILAPLSENTAKRLSLSQSVFLKSNF